MSKWKKEAHVRAALQQHARDLLAAVENGSYDNLLKELTDLAVIAELVGLDEDLKTRRWARFQETMNLPPLG
jgi:hypothetical protein